MNQLEALKKMTVVVADTGDLNAIRQYQPEDATTNPSLILSAAKLPEYAPLIEEALAAARQHSPNRAQQLMYAQDQVAVNIGVEILKSISGRVSTEVDARLSYDTQATVEKARKIMRLYNRAGVGNDRVLIKIAATWQGIRAAEQLERMGIQCNLTLLFSQAQARACAEAGVYLISPFVGRILDWYKAKNGIDYQGLDDPGVQSVQKIFEYYKALGYNTIVMGASFRNIGEIQALAGCDRLTIAPALLAELQASEALLTQSLDAKKITARERPAPMSEAEFYWQHNQDPMAVEKLAEGIRKFASDQESLEALLAGRLS